MRPQISSQVPWPIAGRPTSAVPSVFCCRRFSFKIDDEVFTATRFIKPTNNTIQKKVHFSNYA